MHNLPINWRLIIEELEDTGMADCGIAKEVGCNKSSISRLKRGRRPMHTLGEKLLALHDMRRKAWQKKS